MDAIGLNHLASLRGFVENLDTDNDEVHTADGSILNSVGQISATLTAGSRQHNCIIHVYDGLTDALLSRQSLCALEFLPTQWPKQVAHVSKPVITPSDLQQICADLLAEFSDVFSDTSLQPMNGTPMDIQLESECKPFCVHSSRCIPFGDCDQVKLQLDTLVADAVTE